MCIYTQPECAEGTCALMHTFRVLSYILQRGYQLCSFYLEGFSGPKRGMGSRRYPVFRMWFKKVQIILTLGYRSVRKHANHG